MYTRTAKQEFGKWLKSTRENQKIKRSVLAKAIGYRNINKGCRKILRWENGSTLPDSHQEKIVKETLNIPEEHWQIEITKVNLARKQSGIYTKAQSNIILNTEVALAEHTSMLLRQAPRILQTPHWRHIHLHGQRLFMAYVGGGTCLQLGPLLKTWTEGGLRTPLPDGEFFLTSGQCSPLSGNHTVDGFFFETGERARFRSLGRGVATQLIGNAIKPIRQGCMGISSWSLAQLLSQLNVSIEPAEIFWQGESVGQYDFHSTTLETQGDSVVFPLLKSNSHALTYPDYSIEERWEISGGRRIIIGDLLTGQFGSYHGEKHSVHTPSGQWTLIPGCAVDPSGFPRISWSGDIPPLVQVWLVHNLEQITGVNNQ